MKRSIPIWKRGYFWALAVVAGFGAGLVYLLFFSPLFQFERTEVQGAESVSIESVQELLPAQGNLLLIKKKQMQERVAAEFPEIDRVKVKRNFFGRLLVVEIAERKQVLFWCNGKDRELPTLPCFAVDAKGIAFREEQAITGEMPVVIAKYEGEARPGVVVLDQALIPFLVQIKSSLEGWEVLKTAGTTVQFFSLGPNLISARISEGWDAYFTATEDRAWQETKLLQVLEKQGPAEKRTRLDYIDVRFGNQAYVK